MLLFLNVSLIVFSDTSVIKVNDGDTITIIRDNEKIKVRLYGIDTPEIDQSFGIQAKEVLTKYVLNQTIELDEKNTDRYGRLVAVVYCNGVNINLQMIKDGYAWAYIQYLAFL